MMGTDLQIGVFEAAFSIARKHTTRQKGNRDAGFVEFDVRFDLLDPMLGR